MFDYIDFIKRFVKINCVNGYFYKGEVLDANTTQIKIKDIKGKLISLDNNSILSCEEVSY